MKHHIMLLLALAATLALPFGGVFAQESPEYGESPMLAARVAAGELPPVNERLPENPRVIELPWS